MGKTLSSKEIQQIQNLRKRNTVKQVAQLTGHSLKTIVKYGKGYGRPRPKKRIRKICEYQKCHRTFYVLPYLKSQKYCSIRCANKDRVGSKSPRWKGRFLDSSGFVMRRLETYPLQEQQILKQMAFTNGGCQYVHEHRAIIALELGRPLRTEERVYHKNKKNDDNRRENLVLIPS